MVSHSAEGHEADYLATAKVHGTSGHIGEEGMRLILTNESSSNPPPIQGALQSVVIFHMHGVQPGVTTKSLESSDDVDIGFMHWGDDDRFPADDREVGPGRKGHADPWNGETQWGMLAELRFHLGLGH